MKPTVKLSNIEAMLLRLETRSSRLDDQQEQLEHAIVGLQAARCVMPDACYRSLRSRAREQYRALASQQRKIDRAIERGYDWTRDPLVSAQRVSGRF